METSLQQARDRHDQSRYPEMLAEIENILVLQPSHRDAGKLKGDIRWAQLEASVEKLRQVEALGSVLQLIPVTESEKVLEPQLPIPPSRTDDTGVDARLSTRRRTCRARLFITGSTPKSS